MIFVIVNDGYHLHISGNVANVSRISWIMSHSQASSNIMYGSGKPIKTFSPPKERCCTVFHEDVNRDTSANRSTEKECSWRRKEFGALSWWDSEFLLSQPGSTRGWVGSFSISQRAPNDKGLWIINKRWTPPQTYLLHRWSSCMPGCCKAVSLASNKIAVTEKRTF